MSAVFRYTYGVSSSAADPASATKLKWLPVQNGFWLQAVVPFLFGMLGGGPTPIHLPLLLFWLSSFIAWSALTNWLGAHCPRRLLPPVVLWFVLATVSGVVTLSADASIVPWVALFLPLAALSLLRFRLSRRGSLLARSLSVLAAGMMCAVAWDLGDSEIAFTNIFINPAWQLPLVVTALMIFYFWCAIPFRSMFSTPQL